MNLPNQQAGISADVLSRQLRVRRAKKGIPFWRGSATAKDEKSGNVN